MHSPRFPHRQKTCLAHVQTLQETRRYQDPGKLNVPHRSVLYRCVLKEALLEHAKIHPYRILSMAPSLPLLQWLILTFVKDSDLAFPPFFLHEL